MMTFIIFACMMFPAVMWTTDERQGRRPIGPTEDMQAARRRAANKINTANHSTIGTEIMGPIQEGISKKKVPPTIPNKPEKLRSKQDSGEDINQIGSGLVAARISALKKSQSQTEISKQGHVGAHSNGEATSVAQKSLLPPKSSSAEKIGKSPGEGSKITQATSTSPTESNLPGKIGGGSSLSNQSKPPPIPSRPAATAVSEQQHSQPAAAAEAPHCRRESIAPKATIRCLDEHKTGRSPPALPANLTNAKLNKNTIKGAAVSSTTLATYSAPTISIWDIQSGEFRGNVSMGLGTASCILMLDGFRALVGTVSGNLHLVNIHPSTCRIERTLNVGGRPIVHLIRWLNQFFAVDEAGWTHRWEIIKSSPDSQEEEISGDTKKGIFRVLPNPSVVHVTKNGMLWLCAGRLFEIYKHSTAPIAATNTTDSVDDSFDLLARFECEADLRMQNVAMVTGITSFIDSEGIEMTVTAHEDGSLLVWKAENCQFVQIVKTGPYRIVSIIEAGNRLWVGFATGKIIVIDPLTWRLLLEWKGHQHGITTLIASWPAPGKGGMMPFYYPVLSVDEMSNIGIWDGLLEKETISNMMVQRNEKYCVFTPLAVRICSWNVDAQRPPEDPSFWADWLGLGEAGCPDLIIIGLQEVIDLESTSNGAKILLNAANATKNGANPVTALQVQDETKALSWMEKISIQVHAHGYYILTHTSMVGLCTVFVIKSTWKSKSWQISTNLVKTGLGGLHGNKGAIVTRLLLDHSSFVVANCHLAAGHGQTVARNTDAATILRACKLPGLNPSEGLFASGDGENYLDHEHCIFFGDLNYRLEAPRVSVEQKVANQEWQSLFALDQLSSQTNVNRRGNTHPLSIFRELPITFPPTYKYDRGSDDFDSSEKMRVPAYCDRILFKTIDEEHCKAQAYRSHAQMRISDHRPISLSLHLRVKKIDWNRRDDCHMECRKEWRTASVSDAG